MPVSLPAGTVESGLVTLLFTDTEGSTWVLHVALD